MPENNAPEVSEPPAVFNLNARVAPTAENPSGYPPFNLRLIPTYTNNQLRYYHMTGAMLDADKAAVKNQLKERKTSLELIDWDGNTRENTPAERNPPPTPQVSVASHALTFDHDSEADSNCPEPISGHKGIKFNPSDITRLRYDSNVAQFSNWLEDLKAAVYGDPAKYPTGRHKIIFATMTIDEQLKTTYNSVVLAHPAISSHWRKFKRWIKDIVLHGDSDRLKLSNEFTTARQRVNEDPNQFHLRLFNLGIQSGRTVSIEDYRTRLVGPLQNVIIQQDRTYPTVQDLVAHAGKLWQTLDPDKVRQEIKDERARRQRQFGQRDQPGQSGRSGQPDQSGQRSNQAGRRPQGSQSTANLPQRPRRDRQDDRQNRQLSAEEHQHRMNNNLCFNCGHSGHRTRDCSYRFYPYRVTPRRDKDPAKAQPLREPERGQKRPRPHARSQPTRASKDSDDEAASHADSSESESEHSEKRRKN